MHTSMYEQSVGVCEWKDFMVCMYYECNTTLYRYMYARNTLATDPRAHAYNIHI